MLFKNISFVTANRSDYAKVRYLMRKLYAHPDFNINVLATGSMVSEKYGNAVVDIIADGHFPVKDEYCGNADTLSRMLKSMGLSIIDMASYISRYSPDCGLIVGDRWDILPAALSFCMLNIPVIHIQGGEISGTIDNVIRDTITKLSHIHFTATDMARQRVISLGEDPDHVFSVGCPSIDFIKSIDIGDDVDMSVLQSYIKDPFTVSKDDNYLLVLLHPNVTDPDDIDVEAIFNALLRVPNKKIWFYPNNDPFNEEIVKGIRKHREEIIKFSHISMEHFIMLLGHSACIVGNSSSGIRESSSLGVPSVNIGKRQIGRERNANTVDVVCHEDDIYDAVTGIMGKKFEAINKYGNGGASDKIISVLSQYNRLDYKNARRVYE